MTQWVFTTVSLANLLWFFLLGSGPVGCLLCCLSNGKTQIWLGDLRLALFLFVGVLVVFLVMICQASCDHRRPCSSFLINSFVSCKDRALERDRPNQRKKNMYHIFGNATAASTVVPMKLGSSARISSHTMPAYDPALCPRIERPGLLSVLLTD